jgi:flagellar biosynthesis/type III secretory pathway chaperone
MSDHIDHLAKCLSEKEVILERLLRLLDQESDRIVRLDTAGMSADRESKLLLIEQLEQAKSACTNAMAVTARELGLPGGATLSALMEAIAPSRRNGLAQSRKRLFELVEVLNRRNRFNRELVYGSLRAVNHSIEFFNGTLGSGKTYSGAGLMVSGVSGGRLVSGEI